MLTEGADLQLVVERGAVVRAVQRLGHVLERGDRFRIADLDRLAEPVSRADAAFHRQRLHTLHALGATHRGKRVLAELARSRRARAPGQTHSDSDDEPVRARLTSKPPERVM